MIKHIKLEGNAEWNSSFYVAQISFLCLSLKQCDQFAVTALRASSVEIVGVAKSTIHVKKQRLLDAQINHDPLEIMHLPQTL